MGEIEQHGVPSKMLAAVKSLYASVSSCVRINSHCTDWFDVSTGLLTPMLYAVSSAFQSLSSAN